MPENIIAAAELITAIAAGDQQPNSTISIPAEYLIRVLATHARRAFRDAYGDSAADMRAACIAIATQPLAGDDLQPVLVEVDADAAMQLAFAYDPAAEPGFDGECTEGNEHPAVIAGDAILELVYAQFPEIYARHS